MEVADVLFSGHKFLDSGLVFLPELDEVVLGVGFEGFLVSKRLAVCGMLLGRVCHLQWMLIALRNTLLVVIIKLLLLEQGNHIINLVKVGILSTSCNPIRKLELQRAQNLSGP